jgi:hypothetical protein
VVLVVCIYLLLLVETGHEAGARVDFADCYEINESLVESLSFSFIGGAKDQSQIVGKPLEVVVVKIIGFNKRNQGACWRKKRTLR